MMDGVLLIPLTAVATPLILVPTIMTLKYRHRRREWEHAERMRALELGLPQAGASPGSAKAAATIGGVMPVAVFFLAWLNSMGNHHDAEAAWVGATFVGLAGVIGGVRIANRNRAESRATPVGFEQAPGRPGFMGFACNKKAAQPGQKPAFNPDAYDAIAHRS